MTLSLALAAAVIFAIWHSFSDALAWRIYEAWYSPRRKNIQNKFAFLLKTRSHCESCSRQIPWYGLVPIAGYFFLKGRCAHCGRNLSLRFPILEVFAFGYGALLGSASPPPPEFMTALVAYSLLWIVIYNDYRTLLIPTEVILLLLVLALANLLIFRYPRWYELRDFSLGLDLAVAFVWYFLFHLLRIASGYKMGLADVRLVLALGFLLGHPYALFLPGLAAIFAILFWLFRRYSVLIYAPSGKQIPFGVFLAVGYLVLNATRTING